MSAPNQDQADKALVSTEGPGFEALRQRESALEARWQSLQGDGHGYSGVLARLAQDAKKDAAPDAEERARGLAEADAEQARFLAELDEFQRDKQSHFIAQVLRELDHAMETMADFYGTRQIRSVRRGHRRLKRLAARYAEQESFYGTPRDHKRIETYQRFYAGVVAFALRVRRLDPTAPKSAPRSLVERIYALRRGVLRFARRTWVLLRLLVTGVRLLWVLLSKESASSGTPLTNRVDDVFRLYGEWQGYQVVVGGVGEAGAAPDDGTVRIFAPAHRHGVTDNVTFSHLRLPDYLVFNAVDQLPVVPAFLKERIAATRGLIAVGPGRGSSVERALENLSAGVSRNVLIYPEGSVSEGFRGTRPPRKNFGEGLVRGIREAGFELEIVPVTYLDNARFLDLPPLSNTAEDRRLRVKVGRPLEREAIDALLEAGGGEMVNRTLRLAWLEELVTDEARLLGQDRLAEVERRLDLELEGIRYWGSLESAPVSDRLSTPGGEPVLVHEEAFRGKRVRVLEIPESARDEEGRIVIESLRDPASTELILGLRPPSHIYLSVGRQRFDGDIFRPLKVKNRDVVYPGILIRFTGVPVKSLNAIRRKLEDYSGREIRTLTCANSACRVIARAANMKIDDHAELRPFLPSHILPTRTIRKVIERGVRSHSGELLDYEIYKTDPRPLEQILADMRKEEIRIAKDHLLLGSRGALRSVGSGVSSVVKRLSGLLRRRDSKGTAAPEPPEEPTAPKD